MSDVGTDDKFKKRFADISDEQRKIIISNKDAVNTKRSTAQAIKLLRDYLLEKGLSVQFEDFPPEQIELTVFLASFTWKPEIKMVSCIRSHLCKLYGMVSPGFSRTN